MEKTEIYEILNRAYFSEDSHEKETLERLGELLRGAKCFVDVGASLGQYTERVNRLLRGARLLALEADPVRHEELARNCEKWARDSGNRIEVHHAAAGDENGEITFFVTDSNVSGGLFPHDVAKHDVRWREVSVPARTLDSLCEGFTPDLVKIDVEGGELRVLQGAARLLREGRTRFLVEVHHWVDPKTGAGPREVYSLMRRNGYRSARFHGQRLFMRVGAAYPWFAAKGFLWDACRLILRRLTG